MYMLSVIHAMVSTSTSGPPISAVVVGAGVGGLFCAAKLAREGFAVTVVEQNSRACAGGRLACETIVAPENGRSYRFETGPSLLLLPQIYKEAFKEIGLNPEEVLSLQRCRPSYAVHFDFEDGGPSPLEIGGNAASESQLQKNMEAFEPGSYQAYQDYLTSARANLDAGLPIFIQEQLGLPELAKLPAFLQAALLGGGAASGRNAVLRDWPLRSHAAQASELFEAPRHRALACFQDLYIGLAPADAPAVFSLLQAIELAPSPAEDDSSDSGVFYPLGSWSTIADALLEAAEASGVRFLWDHTATEVVCSDPHATDAAGEAGSMRNVRAVRAVPTRAATCATSFENDPSASLRTRADAASTAASGTAASGSTVELEADCVIVNGDLAMAEATLLPPELRRSAYHERSETLAGRTSATSSEDIGSDGVLRSQGWRYSSSTVTFCFCLDERYQQLRHHNVFLGPENAWDGLFDAVNFKGWDDRMSTGPRMHFYVHAPSRTDESAVEIPTDDAVMVLVPVPPLDERLRDDQLAEASQRIIAAARTAVMAAFERAGMKEFQSHIVHERVRSPLGWRDAYGLRRGSVFGLSHPLEQLSFLRPGRRHPGVSGLHWVGASTRPGNGVPLVLIGAMKTAEEALEDAQARGVEGRTST